MQIDDLFERTVEDGWVSSAADQPRIDVIRDLRAGPIPGDDDLETAIALSRLVHAELEEFGTAQKRQNLTDEELALTQRSLGAVLKRHGMTLALPWRDYSGFRSYWIAQGAAGSGGWQARRDILGGFFEPVFEELHRQEDARFAASVAKPVSPAGRTGWPSVDSAVEDVVARFRSAVTHADYSDVGRRCVVVLEALSATVYDEDLHLREGETLPAISKTHIRIGRFVEDSLVGSGNAEVRTLVRKSAELAEAVKHRSSSTRRDAGIAADAVIMLANILRRLQSDP